VSAGVCTVSSDVTEPQATVVVAAKAQVRIA
jgi:hypothetical protein